MVRAAAIAGVLVVLTSLSGGMALWWAAKRAEEVYGL